jgi:hypothetical protein
MAQFRFNGANRASVWRGWPAVARRRLTYAKPTSHDCPQLQVRHRPMSRLVDMWIHALA